MTSITNRGTPVSDVDQDADASNDVLARLRRLELQAHRHSSWVSWNNKVKWNALTTNVASSGQYQYNGDYINLQAGCSLNGVPANGNVSVDLPVANVQPPGASNTFSIIGQAWAISQGVAHGPMGHIINDGGSPVTAYVTQVSGSLNFWNLATPWTWKNTDAISFNIRYRWR